MIHKLTVLLLVFLAQALGQVVHAATPLRFDLSFDGPTKLQKSRIDSRTISQVHDLVLFVGTDEDHFPAATPRSQWYDLVAFDCRSKDFKVVFAVERQDDPQSVEELLADQDTAQEDAIIYGHQHDWAGRRGLASALSARCGRAQRSAYHSLPYHFLEAASAVWWIDLAAVQIAGNVRSFFAYSRPYFIETQREAEMEIKRVAFKREGSRTYRWAADCAKRTISTLGVTTHSATGSVVEDRRTPDNPETPAPNTTGGRALAFVCSLRK
jgi:hypothetical protein